MFKSKSVLILFLTVIILAALSADACAQDKTFILILGDPYMTVDGVRQEIDPNRGTVPVAINGRTLVPIAAIINNIGGSVFWEPVMKKVIIIANNKVVELTLKQSKARIKDSSVSPWISKTLDVVPQSINSRTMVPLRFITEALGGSVKWDANTKSVTIIFTDIISEEVGILGKIIVNKDTKATVIKKLGNPTKTENKTVDYNPVTIMYYKNTTVEVRNNNANRTVSGVTVTSPVYSTSKGIQIGDSKEKVLTVYGLYYSSDNLDIMSFEVKDCMHVFRLFNGKVSEILVSTLVW